MQKPHEKSNSFTVYLTPPILDRNKLSHWVKVNSVEVVVFLSEYASFGMPNRGLLRIWI